MIGAATMLVSCNTSPVGSPADLSQDPPVREEESPQPATGEATISSGEIDVYYLVSPEWAKGAEKIAFISFSESYRTSEHPDSLAVPDLSGMPYDSVQHVRLTGKFRKRFLGGTGISESDKLFVFDYATGKSLSFPVSKLRVSAVINIYEIGMDMPIPQDSYMIGFEIDRSLLAGFSDGYYRHTLVAVGKENPFANRKLAPVPWKKAAAGTFPQSKAGAAVTRELKGFTARKTYMAEWDTLQFFLRELTSKQSGYARSARHILVTGKASGKVQLEYSLVDDEGTGMAPLNLVEKDHPDTLQWTGQLFKNRNPVLFGLAYYSFSCESIDFIGNSRFTIRTKCDSRH